MLLKADGGLLPELCLLSVFAKTKLWPVTAKVAEIVNEGWFSLRCKGTTKCSKRQKFDSYIWHANTGKPYDTKNRMMLCQKQCVQTVKPIVAFGRTNRGSWLHQPWHFVAPTVAVGKGLIIK